LTGKNGAFLLKWAQPNKVDKMSDQKATSNLDFEAAVAELENIVNQLESGKLPLEKSVSAYKRGAELLQICQKSLSEAEQQVRILTEAGQLSAYNPDSE
jgi:exodeoxyribonuclease VII small subunit